MGSPCLDHRGCVWKSGHLDGIRASFRKKPGSKSCWVGNYQALTGMGTSGAAGKELRFLKTFYYGNFQTYKK